MFKKAIATVFVALLTIGAAHAETEAEAKARVAKLKPADFPNRAVEVTVANPAGGGMDVNGRFFAKYLEKYLGQNVVVNNRVGAGGFVGYQWLATQAPNDGSAIGFVGSSILADSMLRAEGKWTYKDIEPIAFVNYEPVIWMISTTGEYKDKSLKEIAQIAKEKPDTVKVAVAPNSAFEMLAEQVEALTGAKFIKVPFGGDAPARQALLGHHIDVSLGFAGPAKGNLDSGEFRIIGVAGESRLPDYKDAPTFNEQLGSKDVLWLAWRYVGVPKGMAADRKTFLTAAAQAAASDPELVAEFKKIGAIVDPIATPQAASAALDKIAATEGKFYRESGRMK
jgi:tripartite-type tricarboxylate transporter receptor subunit TctC